MKNPISTPRDKTAVNQTRLIDLLNNRPLRAVIATAISLSVLLGLSGCGGDASNGAVERTTAVTVAESRIQTVERVERLVGRLETIAAPSVAAETAGRVVHLHVDAGEQVTAGAVLAELDAENQRLAHQAAEAELRRVQALHHTQQLSTHRLQSLAERQSVSQDQLDQATAQLAALQAQLDAAQSALQTAQLALGRTAIIAPVSGRVQARHISVGDFVSAGQPAFELVSADALQAIVAVPEHLMDDLALGQLVRLAIPGRPDQQIHAAITEIRPMVGVRSRAIEVVVSLNNPGAWRVGGSVNAELVLASRESVVVPQLSVVRRPIGTVVYRIQRDGSAQRARQTLVQVGQRGEGWIEVLSGLAAGEQVVQDGSSFLSDGALLDISGGDQP